MGRRRLRMMLMRYWQGRGRSEGKDSAEVIRGLSKHRDKKSQWFEGMI
jgi:hypothetical protein